MSTAKSRILLCIDGSESSLKAATKALSIAKRFDSEIIALYISVIPTNIRRAPEYVWDEMYDYDLEQVNKWLTSIIEKAKDYHLSFKIVVKESKTSIVKEIITKSEEHAVDLIVLGSTGRSGFESLLMGSVAHGVATYADCSVLVIR